MELDHIVSGNYLLPALKLSDPPDARPLGLYGELHKRYLRKHRPILYNRLLLTERLYPLCREIDEAGFLGAHVSCMWDSCPTCNNSIYART